MKVGGAKSLDDTVRTKLHGLRITNEEEDLALRRDQYSSLGIDMGG